MRNNRMRFGDLLVKQLIGIAMGMSPAPTIANLFVAIHENQDLLPFLETCIKYLKRFINDGIGIWLHDANPITDENNWRTFKQGVNNGGLTWEFTKRCKSMVFMDMTIEIGDGKFVTSLYANLLHSTFIFRHIHAILQEFTLEPSLATSSESFSFAQETRILTKN
ncbi:hypothetical protein ACHAXR_007422 [Thalassiosira sp. AJA248-18]